MPNVSAVNSSTQMKFQFVRNADSKDLWEKLNLRSKSGQKKTTTELAAGVPAFRAGKSPGSWTS